MAGIFVAVGGLAVFVEGGAVVSVTEASVAVEASPQGVLREGVLIDPQAARRIVANKMNPTRCSLLIFMFASFEPIILAPVRGSKMNECHI